MDSNLVDEKGEEISHNLTKSWKKLKELNSPDP